MEARPSCPRRGRPFALLGSVGVLLHACASPPLSSEAPTVLARGCSEDRVIDARSGMLEALLAQEDTDSDHRITILDEGPKRFVVPLVCGRTHAVTGTYRLSNLAQELFLMRGTARAEVPLSVIEEPVVDRISRMIRELYWDGLTRRIDEQSLPEVLRDPKMDSKITSSTADWPDSCTPPPGGRPQFLYVPNQDEAAYQHYLAMRSAHPSLVVCRLPETITPEWVTRLDPNERHGSRHGLLSLALRESGGELQAVPYGVPGGRFNEMYGWDSYFHLRGLLADGKSALARALVENQLYEVRHYGKVLNANRTYYLSRSQPPFLTSAVRALWEQGDGDKKWLGDALVLLEKEYREVWNTGARRTPLCRPVERDPTPSTASEANLVCLATYHAGGKGEPPEVEPGHFGWLYERRARSLSMTVPQYRKLYLDGVLPPDEMNALNTFFLHDRSMRESGHDTTYRFSTEDGGDRCADFATIDLNALLFKYELDLAQLSQQAGQADWERWCSRANARRQLVREYLYDGEIFVDFRLNRGESGALRAAGVQSAYLGATTLYPLWASTESPCRGDAGLSLSLFQSDDEKARLVSRALRDLEMAGGLSSTSEASLMAAERGTVRQWDFPFGWAPHQILAWEGLRRHGFEEEAERLTYRWLYMIGKNARDFHGTVPEKFDVVRRSHRVFAEYGNVGTEFSYITREGFGWMNASFQLGLRALRAESRVRLRDLVPPEQISRW